MSSFDVEIVFIEEVTDPQEYDDRTKTFALFAACDGIISGKQQVLKRLGCRVRAIQSNEQKNGEDHE